MDRDEVSLQIDAPPEKVWAMVTDVTQMGRWSPETVKCKWVGAAAGPTVGAKFKGTNKHGPMRWSTTCTVVAADEASHFAFEVDKSRMRWGYRFEPAGEGTKVTEYREHVGKVSPGIRLVQISGLIGRDRENLMVEGMRATLERIKAAAE